RGIDGPGSQYDFGLGPYRFTAAALFHDNPGGRSLCQQHPGHQYIGFHGQIGATGSSRQIAAGRTAAAALPGGAIGPAETFLAVAVDIIGMAVTGLLTGFQKGAVYFGYRLAGGDTERTAVAMISV